MLVRPVRPMIFVLAAQLRLQLPSGQVLVVLGVMPLSVHKAAPFNLSTSKTPCIQITLARGFLCRFASGTAKILPTPTDNTLQKSP